MPAGVIQQEPLLVASGIDKTFERTKALSGATLSLRIGEIHGLMGANGAGKSTLSRIISGLLQFDDGTVLYRGRPLRARSPREALDAGIALVTQETSLAPDLTVLENIFLAEYGRPGLPAFRAMRHRAESILDQLGRRAHLDLNVEVRDLSAAQRQLVEIAKALSVEAALIIFDEPTASLSPGEVEHLFDIMTALKKDGRALVFVSHRLEEVFAITDCVTVLREGRTVAASVATSSLTQPELIRLMVGQELSKVRSTSLPVTNGDRTVILEVSHLVSKPMVRDVSFALHRGEILGLAGLAGAGRSETVETIFGLRQKSGGTIQLSGKPFEARSATAAIRAGLGFVAEDRRRQSIVPDLSVRENLLLAHLGAHRGFALGYRKREGIVDELMGILDLPRDRLLDANILNFSGGMQQKIIIARWLILEPKVLLLDEPTKGVDIGTRTEIYRILRETAGKGVAIVVISSDFEELLGLTERVVVISDGISTATMPSAMLDEEKLTLLAAPRSSMERNVRFLEGLGQEFGGTSFWALIEGERLFCLYRSPSDPGADPGFETGASPAFHETQIASALAIRADGFVTDAESRNTIVIEARSPRGHAIGWIGLTLPAIAPPPETASLRSRVRNFFANPS